MNRDPRVWARLGQAFAAARKTQGITQEELAERAGVSLGSVQRVEAGGVPKARMPITLHPIARAVGWPEGAVEHFLETGELPSTWQDVSVQAHIDPDAVEAGMTVAMVRASKGVDVDVIKAGVQAAMDELRRQGLI